MAALLEVRVKGGHYWYFVMGQRMLNILQFVLGSLVPPSEECMYMKGYSYVYIYFNVLINVIYTI